MAFRWNQPSILPPESKNTGTLRRVRRVVQRREGLGFANEKGPQLRSRILSSSLVHNGDHAIETVGLFLTLQLLFQGSERFLSLRIPLSDCLLIPLDRFGRTLWYSQALLVQFTKLELRFRAILLSFLVIPLPCVLITLRQTAAGLIHLSQLELRFGTAVARRQLIPLRRLRIILRNAMTLLV